MDAPAHTLSILIVDDHVPVRRRIASMLRELHGVKVVGETGSVADALAAIDALAPDVVTLDISLPDGSGLDVLRRTRDLRPRPLFIVLSAHPYGLYAKEAADLGSSLYFNKSQDFDQLLVLMETLAVGGGAP